MEVTHFTTCEIIQITESGKIFPYGIRNPGLRNLEFSSMNQKYRYRLVSGIQVPLTRNPAPGIQNSRLSWIYWYKAKNRFKNTVADTREGPGGPAPRLLLDQSEAPKAKIIFFETGLPPYLRVSITALLPLPLSEGLDPPLKYNHLSLFIIWRRVFYWELNHS